MIAAEYRITARDLRARRLWRLVQMAVQLTASGGGAAWTLNLDESSANRWLEAAMAASFWELRVPRNAYVKKVACANCSSAESRDDQKRLWTPQRRFRLSCK